MFYIIENKNLIIHSLAWKSNSSNKNILNILSAILLGTCEKARPVNTGSQKHVSKTVKNAAQT